MSSRRSSTKPYIFGNKKASQNNSSPKNPLSLSGFLETKSPVGGRIERMNTTDICHQNSPNRLKDISSSFINSSVDAKTQQDFNASKFSFIKMLSGKKQKDLTEGMEYQKLREEVFFLRHELENKNKVIENLTKENVDLRQEMEELQATVESAKGKITGKLQAYSKKTLELESEIRALKEENRTFRDQFQKCSQDFTDHVSFRNMDDKTAFQENNLSFSKQQSDQLGDINNFHKAQMSMCTSPQTREVRRTSLGSPNQASLVGQSKVKRLTLKLSDPTLSPKMKMNTATPLRNVPLLGNLEKLNTENSGIVQKTISLSSHDEGGLSISSEHNWASNLLTTNLSAFRKTPKSGASPGFMNRRRIELGINENELKHK